MIFEEVATSDEAPTFFRLREVFFLCGLPGLLVCLLQLRAGGLGLLLRIRDPRIPFPRHRHMRVGPTFRWPGPLLLPRSPAYSLGTPETAIYSYGMQCKLPHEILEIHNRKQEKNPCICPLTLQDFVWFSSFVVLLLNNYSIILDNLCKLALRGGQIRSWRGKRLKGR